MYNWAFNFQTFIGVFPELAKVSEAQFSFYKEIAKSYIDINYYFGNLPNTRKDYLAMLVLAHLLSLAHFRQGNGGAGAITNASEGSVSVGFTGLNNMNWWKQTTYGAMFWQIIRPYLTPKLIKGKSNYFDGSAGGTCGNCGGTGSIF